MVAEVYLSRKNLELDEKNTLDLFYYEGPMKNSYLDKLIRRNMFVNLFIEPFYRMNAFIIGWEKHIVKSPQYFPEPDVEHSFLDTPPQLSFQNDEMSQAEEGLKKRGNRS